MASPNCPNNRKGYDMTKRRYSKYASDLTSLGYDTTPLNGKRPVLKGWQKRPDHDHEQYVENNIGVLCGGLHNIVAVDIDVKHKATAALLRDMATDQLGFAPERVGNAPKTLFVYKCTEPFNKIKTGVYEIDNQDAAVEILAEGQQFCASGQHPDTKKNYKWPDDSLMDIPPLKLTELTPIELTTFIANCNNALADVGELKAKSMSGGATQDFNFDFAEDTKMAELSKIEAAVMHIPNNDLHYDDWVRTGMAMKGAVGEEGRELFHRWSKRSDKYDTTETDRLWDSIGTVNRIGAGTVFQLAMEHGYEMDTHDAEIVKEEAEERVEKEYIEQNLGELKATKFGSVAATKIPRREFLYGTHLIAKYVAATIAQGGGSKTTVLLTDAIALATNRDLIGNQPTQQCNAWHYNLEDPIDELQRRVVAICQKYEIPLSEIKDTLFLDSGRTRKLVVAEKVGNIVVATPDVDAVIREIIANNIKAMSIDPFVKSHHVEENDNKQIDSVLDQYARIANETGCAIELAHHVRKPAAGQNQATGDINQARGASAISGAVRSARTISIMSDKEADACSVPQSKKNWYIRIDDAKGNMSAPAEKAVWLERQSITIDNGDEFEPGDSVGVVAPWTPPDAFDGISVDKARELLNTIDKGINEDVRYSKNRGKRWAGQVVVDGVLEVDEERAKLIIKTWISTGVLFEDEYRNGKNRKDEKGVFLDPKKMPESV